MESVKGYSERQFKESGFDSKDYQLHKETGMFTGRLDMKVWGKKCNLISFYTLSNGQKILCNTWKEKDYLGVDMITTSTLVELVFTQNGRGNAMLSEVHVVG